MTKRTLEGALSGLLDVGAFVKGDRSRGVVHSPVKALRRQLGLSQNAFAETYGIPASCIRDWEQGRTSPDKTARAYLEAIARLPEQIAASRRTQAA